jgi:predicted acylesterase/phospholipase RssA
MIDAPLTESEMLFEEYERLHGPLPQYREERDRLAKRKERAALHDDMADVQREFAEAEAALRRKFAEAVHLGPRPLSALCLSGGGIRSATFNLGVIQGLARCGLLRRMDYLSTVSGGGYIGSWLTAWMHRDAGGVPRVMRKLGWRPPTQSVRSGAAAVEADAAEAEPPAVTHLREYSNYLTPRLGAMRPDSATVAATYLRNLLLNWIVFGLALIALALLPRIFVGLSYFRQFQDTAEYLALLLPALLFMAWATSCHRRAIVTTKRPTAQGADSVRATSGVGYSCHCSSAWSCSPFPAPIECRARVPHSPSGSATRYG